MKSLRLIFVFCVAVIATAPSHADSPPEPRFVGALISGSTHYDSEQLSEHYIARIGETLTSGLIEDVADAIMEQYVADGMFRPSVAVIDREVLQGIVGFRISESLISSVNVGGDPGPYSEEISARIEALRDLDHVDRPAIINMLQRLRRLPGLDVSASIRSTADDRRQLQLDVEYSRIESTIQASNRGIEQLGRNIMFGRFRVNGLLGWNETLDLYGAASTSYDRYNGVGIAFGKTFIDGGARLHVSAFVSGAEPDMSQPRIYDRSRLQFRAVKPLVDNEKGWLSISAALQSRAVEITESGVPDRDERLSSVVIGGHFARRTQTRAIYRGDIFLHRGLTGLGTRLDSGSATADPRDANFFVFEFDVARIHRFAERWRFEVGVAGQTTSSVLPTSQRFKIGGADYGRAYDLGEVAGDRGVSGKLELGRQLATRNEDRVPFELYSFYDVGTVWSEEDSDHESAASAGVGLSMSSDRFSGYVELAQALTLPSELDGHDARVFAGLKYRF